ncbi:enoyl-CoA hydratase/isomerase family protein [Falsiroseomonas selenitidurans]|uniref:Enoyl-CoA hydratase n=1 Tax=Falsiroseomonas selenitidurans TaxID=2716335 RepID=A0ABX1DXG4_9PROT|nr:enoyl-CoA hydratase-related protein [Falsiroseomonas selenitidurans]NKC29599.1 enoyl-CoA hydratase [Falsiroseomonas selenitidurans]
MTLRLLRQGAIATLLIDSPARRNAMRRDMWQALPDLVAEAEADPAIALLCLVGEGAHFCGGADISEFASGYATPQAAAESNAQIRAAVEALAGCTKPTLALIRGACVGGGVALALACDLRLASDTARFAVTPVKLGLIYSQADTQRLMQAVGAGRAKEMLFSARQVPAAEALAIGLVDRLWPETDFDAAIAAYAEGLAATSRPALRGVKAMVAGIAAGAPPDAPDLAALFEAPFQGEDFAEGSAAFLARRPPRFTAG